MFSDTDLKNQAPSGPLCGQFVYSAEGDRNILYADENVVRLFGCDSREDLIEFVGNSFPNMVHPDDLAEAEHTIRAQTLESGSRHDYLRYRIVTKQGEVRYTESFGHIGSDENGRSFYYVFIAEIGEEEYYNEYYNSYAESQVDVMNWKVDHLTGLMNIAALNEEPENSPLLSENEPCTVAVFDIIGLMDVNRSAGRIEGDKLIRSLVRSVCGHMPKDSLIYRGYDAEIIAVCRGKAERDVIDQIRETALSCDSKVFFGVASTDGVTIKTDRTEKKSAVMQALEEAQYDLMIKKMLDPESDKSHSLTSLFRALEEVDQDTEEHVMRTRSMGLALGRRLGLSDAQLSALELMCLLHDIGKIAIPLDILNKPGKLTNAEWSVLRSHADKGYHIALASKELEPIAEFIRHHHERWDGNGYPLKLSGDDIPVLSRIISIVDAYDAMVNDRCYRKALPVEVALGEIRDNAGTQFDPHMAKEFLELLSETPELALGKKTGSGEVRVFQRAAGNASDTANTKPVVYCEYKLNVDDRIVEVGPSFEAITGYPPEEILGRMSQFDLIPDEDREDYMIQVGNQFARSNTAFLRHRILRKDGAIINVICHGEHQFDSATRTFGSTIQIYEVGAGEDKEYRQKLEETYESVRSADLIYTHIAHALARGYTDLYYVNMETDEFIEFHTDDELGVLNEARRGSDFFEGCERDAKLFVHKDDQAAFVEAMNREFLEKALSGNRVFELVYRRIKGGDPFYVEMKISRMEDDRRFVVIAVSDIDELMRQRQAEERIQEERIIYARLHAITGNFICVYVVDPETNRYREFSATDDYSTSFAQAKIGTDFFVKVRDVARSFNHPDDMERFLTAFTKENVMAEIERCGIFTLGYRLMMEGRPVHVQMKAAMVEENEGPRLVVGLNDIDVQVRQEEEYGRRLAQAQSQANIDAMTGVKNRHAYLEAEEAMDRLIAEHRQPPFSIAVFDVNDLKSINDNYGHQTGDRCLRDASRLICDLFKHSPVFRIGGDEFAVISQGRDHERLAELIGQMNEHNREASLSGGVVFACGTSSFDNDESVAVVFARADHNMYENKAKLKA